MRFLACPQNCPTTYVSDLFTAICHVTTDAFRAHWTRTLGPYDFPIWWCNNSREVTGMLHRFINAAELPHTDGAHVVLNQRHPAGFGHVGASLRLREVG